MSNRRRPNFLLLVPDQFRRDFVAAHEQMPARTPSIDQLVARGVTFTSATTPSPQCAPARACLASGRAYDGCGVRDNSENFDIGRETFYSLLRDVGYQVQTCGKLDLHKAEKRWGLDGTYLLDELGFTGGMDSEGKLDAVSAYRRNGTKPAGPYMAFLESRGLAQAHVDDFSTRDKWLDTHPTPLPDDAYCDNWIADEARAQLSAMDDGEPWFLSVNFTGPHNPQDVTASMRAAWADADFPPAIATEAVASDAVLEVRRNYAAMVENIDRHIGDLLRIVEERGELDNTVVIFTSDHGEMLGDHDLWGKGVWYDQACGIPMVVAGPGVAGDRRSDALVQFHDIHATVLDYAGVARGPADADLPESSPADSISMRPLCEDAEGFTRGIAVSGLRDWRSAFDGRYKLVATLGEPRRLYDLAADPSEIHDVIADHEDVALRLAHELPDPRRA